MLRFGSPTARRPAALAAGRLLRARRRADRGGRRESALTRTLAPARALCRNQAAGLVRVGWLYRDTFRAETPLAGYLCGTGQFGRATISLQEPLALPRLYWLSLVGAFVRHGQAAHAWRKVGWAIGQL